MEDTTQYRDFYLQTANDYLVKLKAGLEQLKQNSNDQSAQNDMHIAWHSLKSQSDFMGYKTTAVFCHVLELFFDGVLKQQKHMTNELVIVVGDAVTTLENDLTKIKSDGTENDLSQQIESTKSALGVTL